MDKDKIERKVKIEIEFFRIFSIFIIGLVSGLYGIVFSGIYRINQFSYYALITGTIFLLFFAFLAVYSYIKLNKLKKL